jgi:hypothetical protein
MARAPVQLPLAIPMLGVLFTLEAGETVRSQLGDELGKLLKYQHRHDRTPVTPTFVTFTARGAHWTDAWRAAEPAWDAYRGLAAFALGRGTFRIIGGGPRSAFLHPAWFLTRSEGVPLEFVEFALDYEPGRRLGGDRAIEQEKVQRFQALAVPLADEPPRGSTLEVLADCLRLYAQAMDSGQDYSCFLGLWQLAEAITVAKEDRGKTQRVAANLRMFVMFPPVGAGRTLGYLGDRRNNMVHHGILEMDIEDLNILQFACERALGWLFKEWKRLPTRLHLREFYRCRTLNEAELSATAETVALIKESRELDKQNPKPPPTEPPQPGPGSLRRDIG